MRYPPDTASSRARDISSTAWLLTGSTLVSVTGEMEQFKKREYDFALTIQSCSFAVLRIVR